MSQIFTCIYSSHSLPKAKELVNHFLSKFTESGLTFDDLFYAGVFCTASTYVNYEYWDNLPFGLERPEALTSVCSTEQDRFNYVDEVIKAIIKGEIEKPEWMIEIEGTAVCAEESSMSPSTYLYLVPKQPEYEELGKLLTEFLYSTVVNSIMSDDNPS